MMLRKRLIILRGAEQHRRRRRERARKRTAFISNLFQFTKQLLGLKKSGKLLCIKEQMDQNLQCTFSDPDREVELGNCNALIRTTEAFDLREPLFEEVQQVVKKARAGSGPSPSGTTYNIYNPSAPQENVEDLPGHLEDRQGAKPMETRKRNGFLRKKTLRTLVSLG